MVGGGGGGAGAGGGGAAAAALVVIISIFVIHMKTDTKFVTFQTSIKERLSKAIGLVLPMTNLMLYRDRSA